MAGSIRKRMDALTQPKTEGVVSGIVITVAAAIAQAYAQHRKARMASRPPYPTLMDVSRHWHALSSAEQKAWGGDPTKWSNDDWTKRADELFSDWTAAWKAGHDFSTGVAPSGVKLFKRARFTDRV